MNYIHIPASQKNSYTEETQGIQTVLGRSVSSQPDTVKPILGQMNDAK
jgi:hypothetical protein